MVNGITSQWECEASTRDPGSKRGKTHVTMPRLILLLRLTVRVSFCCRQSSKRSSQEIDGHLKGANRESKGHVCNLIGSLDQFVCSAILLHRGGGGGYFRQFWIGVCCEGSWTLTLFKPIQRIQTTANVPGKPQIFIKIAFLIPQRTLQF